MIKKVLVANRGEIALRVIRACKALGLQTVAIHSTVDAASLHVKFADESVCIGPANSKASYLNIHAVLSAAEITGADAVHPGYGFLAENSEFADVCKRCNITFIGPKPETIKDLGNKVLAKEVAKKAKVPILPSSDGYVSDPEQAIKVAKEIGFPVIIKAAMGGGGRGMKIVRSEADISNAIMTAQQEAGAAFGDPSVYIERYCENPRHVEIQIIADAHGNVVHLGERDCSVQRRHQKLIEEAPCPVMTPELRAKMGAAAISIAKTCNYQNAGTVEFLLDHDGSFYFLEVNTRIQVEHPVTEAITGIDLVREQLRVADGHPLSFTQDDIIFRGHAIECRINAEDAFTFAPSPGKITAYHPPGGHGVRIDSLAYANYTVVPNYDSLVCKLIVHAEDRLTATRKMKMALNEFVVEGIKTSIPFYKELLENEEFLAGKATTAFLPRFIEGLTAKKAS